MKKIALIFAGGTGQRVGADIPKQFLQIYGKEIIIHTLELFENNKNIDEIYVACKEDWIPYLRKLLKKYELEKVTGVFPGGNTGQDSIYRTLEKIKESNDNAIVLIHDGVRPLVTEETINNCVKTTEEHGSAVPVVSCYETPIVSTDGVSVEEMPTRKNVYLAQAPQGYYLNDILEAHTKERIDNPSYDGIVDSCGLMFKHGFNSYLIPGDRGNIKVTTPADFYTLINNFNIKDYEQIAILKKKR